MQHQVKFLLVVLFVAAFSSLVTLDRGTSGRQDLAGSVRAAGAALFNETCEAALCSGEREIADGRSSWLLAANKDDDGKNGNKKAGDAEEEEEEKDDGGEDSGFDRLWDVTCYG